MRWLTAPANRMPDGNGNPAIPTVILSIFLLYNKTYWMAKNIANLSTNVTAAVKIKFCYLFVT